MTHSADLFVAVGGVFLVTWYGLSRARNRRSEGMCLRLNPESEQFKAVAVVALAAEFREEGRGLESLPGGSVFCPDCDARYPAGVLYCDCGVMTQEAQDGEDSSESPDPLEDEELVCVHVVESSWKATLLMSFLESHDIPCAMSRAGSGSRHDLHNSLFGETRLWEIKLLVASEDAERAKELLAGCL